MTRSSLTCWVVTFSFLIEPTLVLADGAGDKSGAAGTVPSDASGRPLNLGFETGNLTDWTAEGTAFQGQPVEGDTVSPRRDDMHSGHAGRFWVGSYERIGDVGTGTLTSVPFRAVKPFASFLVGGGSRRRPSGDRAEG